MNLQYIPDDNYIMALDSLISEFAADNSLYASVEVTATLDCNNYTKVEYATSIIKDTTHQFYLENEYFVIQPSMFNVSVPSDGIYRVDIRLKTATGYDRLFNCIFIDDTFKCRVATMLSGLIDEDGDAQMAHLLHYSLLNGSNCGCECDAMCTNFDALETILDNQPVQATDCGCK